MTCNPLSGRGTVSCAGANGHWQNQALRAVNATYLSTNLNMIGNVAGSADMVAQGTGVDKVWSLCAGAGGASCGSGSRNYSGTTYSYSFGYTGTGDAGGDGALPPWTTLFLHGDYSYASGVITWSGSITHTLPASFYLPSKPSWFGSAVYPPIGPDVTGGLSNAAGHAYPNPAMVCYTGIMGGTDGTGSPMAFNAGSCYASQTQSTGPPAPPTGLNAVAN